MSIENFRIGDRVRIRYPEWELPPESLGTIVSVFHGVSGFYDVCFDHSNVRHIIQADDLELLPQEDASATRKISAGSYSYTRSRSGFSRSASVALAEITNGSMADCS